MGSPYGKILGWLYGAAEENIRACEHVSVINELLMLQVRLFPRKESLWSDFRYSWGLIYKDMQGPELIDCPAQPATG